MRVVVIVVSVVVIGRRRSCSESSSSSSTSSKVRAPEPFLSKKLKARRMLSSRIPSNPSDTKNEVSNKDMQKTKTAKVMRRHLKRSQKETRAPT